MKRSLRLISCILPVMLNSCGAPSGDLSVEPARAYTEQPELARPNLQGACLSAGDQTTINNALAQGGAGAVVSLCPGAVFKLTNSVVFNAPNQELSTQGYPTDATRATLVVTGSNQTNAVLGSCGTCSGISLRNIQVDGSRPALGRLDPGDALIEIGGPNQNQVVDHVHAFEPRAWSALHIIEGNLNCSGARITYNDIGPSGNSDGEWADGISMACTNSTVANNTITDATDGAIVLFGAPGTVVANNTVVALTRTLLGGINLVDYGPFSGNYTNTTVTNNTINAQSAFIKTGIAIGPAVWGGDTTSVNRGGIVTNNTFTGTHLGYGIAVAGAADFTVTGNTSTATYTGNLGSACYMPLNAAPSAFVYNPDRATGVYQADFIAGRLQYVICIEPGASHRLSYGPGQLNLSSGERIQLDNASLYLSTVGSVTIRDVNNDVLWSSGTRYRCGRTCTLTLSQQGVLTLAHGAHVIAKWPASGATPGTNASLIVQDSVPYLTLNDGASNTVWASSYRLPNFHLMAGQYVEQNVAGVSTYLTLDKDANLRVYSGALGSGGSVLWSSGVTGKTCGSDCFAVLQGDGNVVTYAGGAAVWATGTNSSAYTVAGVAFNAHAPYVQVVDTHGNAVWNAR